MGRQSRLWYYTAKCQSHAIRHLRGNVCLYMHLHLQALRTYKLCARPILLKAKKDSFQLNRLWTDVKRGQFSTLSLCWRWSIQKRETAKEQRRRQSAKET